MRRGSRLCASAIAVAHLVLPMPLAATMVYLDLEPGTTSRDRVVAALGAAIGGDDVLSEHQPQEGTGTITAEYRASSTVVERIEVQFVQPIARPALAEALGLQGSGDRRLRGGSILLEWFDAPHHIAFTYAGENDSSGVVSIDYYSPKLFACRRAVAQGVTPGELCAGFTETPRRETPRRAPSAPPVAPSTNASESQSPTPYPAPVLAPTPGGLPTASVPTPASPAAPVPPPSAPSAATIPPSIRRDPAACYDIFLFADAQEKVAQRARQVVRRQRAMDIRLKAQAGDCDTARTLAAQYRVQFP